MKLEELRKGYQVWHGQYFNATFNTLEEAKDHIAFRKEDQPEDDTPWYIVHIKDFEFIHV